MRIRTYIIKDRRSKAVLKEGVMMISPYVGSKVRINEDYFVVKSMEDREDYTIVLVDAEV